MDQSFIQNTFVKLPLGFRPSSKQLGGQGQMKPSPGGPGWETPECGCGKDRWYMQQKESGPEQPFPSPEDLPDPGIEPYVPYVPCIGGQVLYH